MMVSRWRRIREELKELRKEGHDPIRVATKLSGALSMLSFRQGRFCGQRGQPHGNAKQNHFS
jgi:hypothetical protein